MISSFSKTYDHQIWQAGTSTGADTNETNQAGAGDVILSVSRDFEKIKIMTSFEIKWQAKSCHKPLSSHRLLVYSKNYNFYVFVCSLKIEYLNRTSSHRIFIDAQFCTVPPTYSYCKLLHFNVNVWQWLWNEKK